MNEELWLREALLQGEPEPEALTFGELLEVVELGRERERRRLQNLALIAYRHAELTARALMGERLPPLSEVFPFWTEEELREARLAHYRGVMERHAAADRADRKEHANATGTDPARPGTCRAAAGDADPEAQGL
ncbi:MAG: hypothetical protein IJ751_03955 [Oscillospiraceae bacterium]|nr:hypothetical protein [Oscillospiraceae bacterium]